MKNEWLTRDVPAGVVVFLVALPLCLGVAIASGVPPIAGIISGIIGGIIVGIFSKSQTSVSGPAAGLTAVVIAALESMGSIELLLVAILLSGFIQILLGFLRAGMLSQLVPSSVIQGLLAAIGMILILNQIPHALGFELNFADDFSFVSTDQVFSIHRWVQPETAFTPFPLLIASGSVLILIFWKKITNPRLRMLPPSLLVVGFGIGINLLIQYFFPDYLLAAWHTVQLPDLTRLAPTQWLHLPTPEALERSDVWMTAISIGFIASLETLLNIEAVDKLDPRKRFTPPNRELMAQGIGNIVAGLAGGIPVTSVIVRSSVNLEAGNHSKVSTILHGLFILLAVVFLRPVMNLIPLSALAAILLVTGYKLVSPSQLKVLFLKGWRQFLPFAITLLVILLSDLLMGVLAGILFTSIVLFLDNIRNPFLRQNYKLQIGSVTRLEFSQQVTFLNKPAIKKALWGVSEGEKVIIDARHTTYIDADIQELLQDFQQEVAPSRQVTLKILQPLAPMGKTVRNQFDHLDSTVRQQLTPLKVMNKLKAGNRRFISGKASEEYYHLASGLQAQIVNPTAVILTCMDSRISPEIIFDSGLGDLMIIRIAGNVIGPAILGSLEMAIEEMGAKLIVVTAHSGCEAVRLAIKNHHEGNVGFITDVLQFSLDSWKVQHAGESPDADTISRLNNLHSIRMILEGSNLIRKKINAGEVGLVGAFHHSHTGKVEFGDLIEHTNPA